MVCLSSSYSSRADEPCALVLGTVVTKSSVSETDVAHIDLTLRGVMYSQDVLEVVKEFVGDAEDGEVDDVEEAEEEGEDAEDVADAVEEPQN